MIWHQVIAKPQWKHSRNILTFTKQIQNTSPKNSNHQTTNHLAQSSCSSATRNSLNKLTPIKYHYANTMLLTVKSLFAESIRYKSFSHPRFPVRVPTHKKAPDSPFRHTLLKICRLRLGELIQPMLCTIARVFQCSTCLRLHIMNQWALPHCSTYLSEYISSRLVRGCSRHKKCSHIYNADLKSSIHP